MVDYLEFHIGKKAGERVIFISLIVILIIISMFAFKGKGSCPEVVCDEEVEIVEEVEEEINTPSTIEEPEAEIDLSYYVDIENMNFAPKNLIIRVGSKVIFRNNEPATAHKVYEVKGLFRSPRMNPGDEFEHIFEETGEYVIWSVMGLDRGTKMEIEVIED
tara:strand:+ start:185 stop:667 length:483 start_codon:yes stop_codon:yes gene_type:complete